MTRHQFILITALLLAVPTLAQTTAKKEQPTFHTLTGTVIRKPWTKSYESWNAGGSHYYVLQVEKGALPVGTHRTAKEGVILRPSENVPFEKVETVVGQRVTCKGIFVVGQPDTLGPDSTDQMPADMQNPITDAKSPPLRGSGFKVHEITIVE